MSTFSNDSNEKTIDKEVVEVVKLNNDASEITKSKNPMSSPTKSRESSAVRGRKRLNSKLESKIFSPRSMSKESIEMNSNKRTREQVKSRNAKLKDESKRFKDKNGATLLNSMCDKPSPRLDQRRNVTKSSSQITADCQ